MAPARGGEDLLLGSADVRSQFLAVSPETAGLSAGVVLGETLADYQNDVARAQSRALNLGIVGTAATAEKCDGDPPDLHRENLPTTVRVDSRQPGAADGRTDYWPILPRDLPYQFDEAKPDENGEGGLPTLDPPSNSPARSNVSRLHARAAAQPSSLATSDTGVTHVIGVAEAIGGHTSTATRVEGGRRIGEAQVTIPELRLGGGAVALHDLEWRAVQSTGPGAPGDVTFSATFRMGGATVGGNTFGWPDAAAEDANGQVSALTSVVNTALAPSGLVVDFPKARQDGDHAIVTPLSVKVDRPPLGRELFAILPKEVYDARREVFDRILEADCNNATYIAVADILLATPAGAGTTRVSFGGADAFTEGTRFANPFATRPRATGAAFVPPASEVEAEVLGTQVAAPEADFTGPIEPLPNAGGPVGEPGTYDVAAGTAIRAPGSKSGAAAVVGVVGLMAALGVALLDFRKPRQARAEGAA